MKVLAGIFEGLILAIVGAIIVTVAFAVTPERGSSFGIISFFAVWVISIVVAVFSPSAPKAWRRLLISSSIASFLLPISALVYTGSFMAKHMNADVQYAGARAAGAMIGGGLVSGFVGFVGFFLGIVFLIIGLLVGRDKKVIYIQESAPAVINEK